MKTEDSNVDVQIMPTLDKHTILFGKATEPLPIPKAVKIDGIVNAPRLFVQKRAAFISPSLAHVLVDRINRTITLVTDETNPINKVVTGELEIDPDLAAFTINGNKMYTVKELADLLRLRRQFFRDRDGHTKIMKELGNFSAKTNIEFKDADDRKGNAEELRKRVSDINLALEFTLNVPVYKGFEKMTFHVEILADVTDGGVRLWLESVELAELLKTELDRIFAVEIAGLQDYVVIEQ